MSAVTGDVSRIQPGLHRGESGAVYRSGPPNTYGITRPTKARHQYNKMGRLSREFPYREAFEIAAGRLAECARRAQDSAEPASLTIETSDGLGFLIVDIKHGVKLGDLQEVRYFLAEV